MITAITKRMTSFLLAFAVAVGIVLTAMPIVISAESESYEETNVLDDLRSSTVNGEPFDIADYPFDETKDIEVVSVVEYAYSYKANQRDHYGLYIYVYNPQGKALSQESSLNKIQMAVRYDSDGNIKDYEKFGLQFCSKTDSGDYKNLFYKFKVIDRKIDGKTMAERVNSNARRYDISGIELARYGEKTATEYGVSGTYTFTGYAEGLGPDATAKSTLDCKVKLLESIELSVKHTFYRSKTSSLGAGHQNQLDTVYFSVPKRYIETYGKLQRIKAEWYEYKTKEVVVTSNPDFYNAAKGYIGTYMGDLNAYGMYPYVESVGYSLGSDLTSTGDMNIASWGWNLGQSYLHPACQRLCYLFYVNDIASYDPYANKVTGGVQESDLYDWITSYNKSYADGYLPIKDGSISADLFMSDIDESRKLDNESGKIQMGYSYYDFDADVDLQTLQSWSSGSPSFWDNWLNFGLGSAFTGGPTEESRTVAPIEILKDSDLSGSDAEISERLLVNIGDVSDIKAEYNSAKKEDEVLVLFRFATSDYTAKPTSIVQPESGFLWSDKITNGQAYVAQESVFLDFDIIQLTFHRDGVYTVIPAVSSPMDIINGVTPPILMPSEMPLWKLVLAIILLVLFLFIFAPILPYIIKLVAWVLLLPVKLLKAIIKGFRRLGRRKEE